MITAAVVALVVSVIFAVAAPGLGRRLPPALATRVLVGGSLAVAGSTEHVGSDNAGPPIPVGTLASHAAVPYRLLHP